MISPKPNHKIFIAEVRVPFFVKRVIRAETKSSVAVVEGNWGYEDRVGKVLTSGEVVEATKVEVATQFIVTQEPA